MPRFAVRLETAVVYQPHHPIARREVTELVVLAPDARTAETHACRVTAGDFRVKETLEVDRSYATGEPPAQPITEPIPVTLPGD